jgi:hypothetical protein
VPFKPKLARIQEANRQLAGILGHSLQIELDGSLLPQSQDGADDVIARLVEDVARELDGLGKESPPALDLARKSFERLVVRYAPSEAAAREDRWRRSLLAKLDLAGKTVDVVCPEAVWRPLERGEIATVLYRAWAAGQDERYGRVLPDALPSSEHRAWFDYHAHGRGGRSNEAEPYARVGSVDGRAVLGMVMLQGLAKNDPALSKDVRAWLVRAADAFSGAYHNAAQEVEAAPPSSLYRRAESAYMAWLKGALPTMTVEERGEVANHLWVTDFRKPSGDRDRFASYAFPGIDLMAFSFDTVDAWIAAGHPGVEPRGAVPRVFDVVVGPAYAETGNDGQIRFQHVGRSDYVFYRWALSLPAREDLFVKGLVARPDPPFATSAFLGARHALREEADYLRLLRRFEPTPALWRVGADVHREVVYRPSPLLLEESRRLWRDMPFARGHVLLWFARHADGSYHPETDWPDMVQGALADEQALGAYLDLGVPAWDSLAAAWPGIARGPRRTTLILARAEPLLTNEIAGRRVPHALAAMARLLCDEGAMGELAQVAAFARAAVAAHPGLGLSDVVEAADLKTCHPKAKPARPPAAKRPPKRSEPNLPKDYKDL